MILTALDCARRPAEICFDRRPLTTGKNPTVDSVFACVLTLSRWRISAFAPAGFGAELRNRQPGEHRHVGETLRADRRREDDERVRTREQRVPQPRHVLPREQHFLGEERVLHEAVRERLRVDVAPRSRSSTASRAPASGCLKVVTTPPLKAGTE